jgi:hypothetical protein
MRSITYLASATSDAKADAALGAVELKTIAANDQHMLDILTLALLTLCCSPWIR